MSKFLISGIPPSFGGVGFLMYNLDKLANRYGWKSIYPFHVNRSIKNNMQNPIFIISELKKRYIAKRWFVSNLNRIKNSEIILVHPQTIGYKYFLKLIENNFKVKIYIMDNSFFCIRSYNVLNNSECLKCLGNLDNCNSQCIPFPVKYNKKENLKFLKEYQKISHKVIFYAQNESQKSLLTRHFGENTKIEIIGLRTGETFEKVSQLNNGESYDIVYHGANIEAKGINYFINLAKVMPEYSFFVPSKLEIKDLPKNLYHENMKWNSGLKEIVINAKLVLNPSLWSAPIEGALLKSIYYNGNVGVVKTKYGFVNDIPNDAFLKLPNNISNTKDQIEKFFKEEKSLKGSSQSWLNTYFNFNCCIEKLFMSKD